MPSADGLFANGGWIQSPRDIEFASKGAFRFRELKTELQSIFSCFLKPDYLGSFADDVIESRTLVDTGVTPGVYNNVTVNAKGQVIAAQLKNPLGDPIHSPGGSGFIDCGDIPTVTPALKGMTRVRIDEFGRVIEGDCVAPHATTPTVYDETTVDKHGRVTAGVFNNFKQQIQDLEDVIDAFSFGNAIGGEVSSGGAVASGTGFSSSKLGTGRYRITWTIPFSGGYGFSATPKTVTSSDSGGGIAKDPNTVNATPGYTGKSASSIDVHFIVPPQDEGYASFDRDTEFTFTAVGNYT
jgi:hypothetical protein